jgi:hypothetical protein
MIAAGEQILAETKNTRQDPKTAGERTLSGSPSRPHSTDKSISVVNLINWIDL